VAVRQNEASVAQEANSNRSRYKRLVPRLVDLAERNRSALIWAVMLFPLFFVTLLIAGKLFAPAPYRALIAEDGIVEYSTFLVYLLASGFAVALTLDLYQQRQKFYALLYCLLATGLFVIGMEEISWGQRIFNLENPTVLNEKGEMNFHNMGSFPLHISFIIVGFYGAFARILVPRPLKERYPRLVDLLTPQYPLFFYFFIPLSLYAYYEYLYRRYLVPLGLEWREFFSTDSFVIGNDQEPIELLLSLGFLLFVIANNYLHGTHSLPWSFSPGRR
jgi:hypothetical protein